MMKNRKQTVYRLTESALLLAIASVLSVVKIVDMPFGGSVTAFSMLPLLIIAYRHGTGWGLFTAFVYSLIQLLLGLDNFSYATSWIAAVTIALFDYLLAFLSLGLGGLVRGKLSQGAALSVAAVYTGLLRYLCHVITGCTVWAGLSVPTSQAIAYSLSYNATYMIPEILVLVLGAIYLSRLLSFDGIGLSRAVRRKGSSVGATVLSAVACTVLLAAAVSLVVYLAPFLQFEDGSLLLTGLACANWSVVLLIALGAAAVFAVLEWIASRLARKRVAE